MAHHRQKPKPKRIMIAYAHDDLQWNIVGPVHPDDLEDAVEQYKIDGWTNILVIAEIHFWQAEQGG